MANENKDIGEIVKKCKILLLDIEGTTTSISFVKDTLFPYAEENVKQFLESQWGTDEVKDVVASLRKLALEDKENSVDGAVVIPGEDASKEDQIEGLVNNVKWQMSSDRKASALKQLQGMIWQQGYDKGDIKGHVYEDVSAALEQWRSVDDQKVYIYSSGSVQAQKLLFGQSLAGDLLKFIDGHFDTAVGPKQEGTSYTSIVEKIGVKPENVLFLTDILKEAEAARTAGLRVALVSREGNAPLPAEAAEAYAVLHSLAQLTVTNKRKTETQDEQPAKVPKTDTDDDVKTTSDSAVSDKADAVKEIRDEQENMEVEEVSADIQKAVEERKVEETTTNTETVIEDVTDTVVPVDVPMMEVEPVITEVEEEKPKTGDDTELMDTEVIEKKNDAVTEKDVEKTNIVTKSDEVSSKPDENSNATEVLPPNDSKESIELKPSVNKEAKSDDEDKKIEPAKEPEKDEIETQVINKKADEAEETPSTVITEIDELTAENLGDVADMMEDLVPVVEEPTSEDMEELQNVGEVLEKECDEILSKVQEVTNLDNIPLKPLLNPIAEETMETELDAENMDSNDIVDRILDTELDLELKQCSEIDLNSMSEMSNDEANEEQAIQNKTIEHNSDLGISSKSEEKVIENDKKAREAVEITITEGGQTEDKAEVEIDNKDKVEKNFNVDNDDKVENNDSTECNNKIENKEKEESKDVTLMDDKIGNLENVDKRDNSEVSDNLESKDIIQKAEKVESKDQNETKDKNIDTQLSIAEDSKDKLADSTKNETKDQVGSTDADMTTDKTTGADSEKDKELPVNGKDTNGDTVTVNVNGDASKMEELNSRLSAENGKQTVNGSNGDSLDTAKEADKMEADDSDIKVKTVATDEPPTDPIEQPTEA